LVGQFTSYQGLVPYALLIGLGLLIADSFRNDIEPVAFALVGSGAAAAVYAVAQRFGWDPIDWSLYGTILPGGSTLGNPNFAGSFFAVVTPLAIGLAILRRGPASLALLVANVGGVAAAASEGAVLAAVGGAAVCLGLLAASRWRPAPVVGAAVATLCALSIVGAVGAGLMSEDVASRSTSIQDRGWYWLAAGGMILDHPVAGHGPDSFAVEGVSYRRDEEGVLRAFAFTFDAHSVPLNLTASNGVIALAALVFLLLWTLRQAADDPVERSKRPSGLWVGFFGAAVAYFVQSLWATDQLSVRMGLWVALGSLAASRVPQATDAPAEGRERGWVPALALIGVVAAIAGALFALRLVRSDHLTWLAISADREGRPAQAALYLTDAVEIRGDHEYRKLLGRALGGVAQSSEDPEPLESAMRDAFAYLEDFPDPEGLATYASFLHSTADGSPEQEEESLTLFRKAVRIDGTNPLIRVGMSDVLIALGEPDAAHELLEPLFYGFPAQPQYWGALALANAHAGDFGPARNYMNQAFAIDPGDPRALAAQEIIEDAGRSDEVGLRTTPDALGGLVRRNG
jgi:O-antigen ligase